MDALNLKLLRDLRRLWAQALAIALVLACGVMTILMSFGMSAALDETRMAYYERNRFGDVFARAVRVPRTLEPAIAAIDGVDSVETRVVGDAILDVPGRARIATGHFIGLPDAGGPRLNVPILRSGAWPEPHDDRSVVVNEAFAQANTLRIGDHFAAILNGAKRELTVIGTALSPEFIYTIGPGALMPDDAGYAIVWISGRVPEAAWDMADAFNDVSLKLVPGTREAPVIDALDDLLASYGGLGAHGRDLQISNSFLDAEIEQLRVIAYIMPPVFLSVSAFLVGIVFGRLIALERGEIGVLKAIGYSNIRICVHYVLLAGLIATLGIVVGWIAGQIMARWLAAVYARFYDFPYLIYQMPGAVYAISAIASLGAATLGSANSALRAARLAPAVAMAPPGPTGYRHTIVDRLLALARLSQPTLMILREIIRFPLRSGFTVLGLSLAVAILVAAGFFSDSFDEIVEQAFDRSNRQDVMLLFAEDVPVSALTDARRLPGVLQAEPQIYQSAVLRHGRYEKRTSVEGRPPGADLSRVLGETGPLDVPPGSIVLSDRLAAHLRAGPGDIIEIDLVRQGDEVFELAVSGTITQSFGLGAYVDATTLDRLQRRAPQLTVVNLTLDAEAEPAFHDWIKEIPRISGAIMMTENRRSFSETIEQNMLVMVGVYGILGIMITVGVAYNGARVQLSERARELASLRILGFTGAEVAYILVGQMLLLALIAQPIGWWFGGQIARTMTDSFSSDLYAIPLVLEPSTFAFASLVVLTATALSLVSVTRRLQRLDLVAVMKTRE